MNPPVLDARHAGLQPAMLLQSGGEGMVFALDEQRAVKLYHQPTPERGTKLEAFVRRYAGLLPGNVLGPQALLRDQAGRIIGFQMARLPINAISLKQLAQQSNQGSGVDLRAVVQLFLEIHATVSNLHRLRLIVGDLNDHNLYIAAGPPLQCYWVDVDSYQFAGYPCPVALLSFLDPKLYQVKDLSQRPVFSEQTDWYAFFVLLVKALLHVHPFGGVHHQKKSLQARAVAGITILHPDVIYPKSARPIAILSDELLSQMDRVFTRGERPPFPEKLLTRYLHDLHDCRRCGISYPAERSTCPACQQKTALPQHPAPSTVGIRPILETEGEIVHIAVERTGRIVAIVRQNDGYDLLRLGVGGLASEQRLFQGAGNYRFGHFQDHLVVNPEDTSQLMILEMGAAPRKLALLQTGEFLGRAVFATTPVALYRLAGGYIMRGIVRRGLYLEEVVATARPNQTQLWAAQNTDRVAGSARFFAEHHGLLLVDGKRCLPINLPHLPGESVLEMHAVTSSTATAFLMLIRRGSDLLCRYALYDEQGRLLQEVQQDAHLPPHNRLTGKALIGSHLYHATDTGILRQSLPDSTLSVSVGPADAGDLLGATDLLHAHPAGLLIHQPHRLLFADKV